MKKKIIIYDFDGTLTPYPITKFEILDKCGLVGGTASPVLIDAINKKIDEGYEHYYAIYNCFLDVVRNSEYTLNDENISLGAEKLEYNTGVFEYFDEITNNRNIKNYLISSGIKVLLDKTKISKYFDEIYATTFKYDNDIIIDTDYLMSDKKKVEIIKKILVDNGYSDNDCSDVIYIGDGLTDLYAMEYIRSNGGESVFVYLDSSNELLNAARESDAVSYFDYADYSINSSLFNYIIERI